MPSPSSASRSGSMSHSFAVFRAVIISKEADCNSVHDVKRTKTVFSSSYMQHALDQSQTSDVKMKSFMHYYPFPKSPK